MTQVKRNPSKVSLQRKLQGLTRPLVLLSCEVSFNKLKVVNDMTMAEAFRQSWTCQPLKQKRPPVVAVCHVAGVIKKIYQDLQWYPAAFDRMRRLGHSVGFIEGVAEKLADGTGDFTVTKRMLERVKDVAMNHSNQHDTDLWNFTGNEAPEYNYLIGVDLSAELTQRGMANPVRYVNCD